MTTERKVPGLRCRERNRDRDAVVYRIRCNLCQAVFRTSFPQIRFCHVCRTQDETYRFSEWLERGGRR